MAYHPQGYWLVKNFNRTLQARLAKLNKDLGPALKLHSSNCYLLISLVYRRVTILSSVWGGYRGLSVKVDGWSGHCLEVGKADYLRSTEVAKGGVTIGKKKY